MIFVTLGTQDKGFPRLLDAIEKEIENGTIKEKVIVQAGLTKYESDDMEIIDLIPAQEFEDYVEKADLIITHGGAGSILTAIKHHKKVISAARLSKYKEHTNDHQKQIVREFAKDGYIMELRDFNKLGKLIEKSKTFIPKRFESNTSNIIKIISEYIEKVDNVSWYNKYSEGIWYLFFGGCTTLVNLITKWILLWTIFDSSKAVELQVAIIISWIVGVLFAYVTNRMFVFSSKNKNIFREIVSFFGSRVITLIIEMVIMYMFVTLLELNVFVFTIISQVIVIILNYIFSKLFVFKK